MHLKQITRTSRVSDHTPMEPRRILIVDSDRSFRASLGRTLRGLGWQTLECGGIEAATVLLNRNTAALVLLHIAEGTPQELQGISALRTMGEGQPRPVITMSGIRNPAILEAIRKQDIAAHLPRPFPLGMLLDCIKKLFGGGAGADGHVTGRAASGHDGREDVPHQAFPGPARVTRREHRPIGSERKPALLILGTDVPGRPAVDEKVNEAYQVILVSRGPDALVESSRTPPRAILLDLHTIVGDPMETYQRLRYLPHLLKTPFIVIRSDDPRRCRVAEKAGLIHFVDRPVRADALARVLRVFEKATASGGRVVQRYIRMDHCVPLLRWPDAMKLEGTQDVIWAVHENMEQLHEEGYRRIVVDVPAIRRQHSGHVKLMLSILNKANELGMEVAVVASSPDVTSFFREVDEIASMPLYTTRAAARDSFLQKKSA